jgi:hypothetical protein
MKTFRLRAQNTNEPDENCDDCYMLLFSSERSLGSHPAPHGGNV